MQSGIDALSGETATKESVAALIRVSCGAVEVGSGEENLEHFKFHQSGGWTNVVLESDLPSAISGLYDDIVNWESGLIGQARQLYPFSGADDYSLATEVARRAFCGDAVYEAFCGMSGSVSGVIRKISGIASAFEYDSMIGTLATLARDIESTGTFCTLVEQCLTDKFEEIESGISGLENCCENVSNLSGAVSDLNSAISSLNSSVSGITSAISGIADAVSGLPAAIVAAIDAAADEPDASPAMVRAAAKIADVAPQEVHNMNVDINGKVDDLADALDGVADAAGDVSDALDEVADATEGSTSETASEASSGAAEVADTASDESTGIGAITFFP